MTSTEGFWTAEDGARIFTRRSEPDAPPKGNVLVVHGVCEHSGRYQALTTALCGAGYAVSAFDLRGHGRSPGRRGDARFGPTFRDLDLLLEAERRRGRPVFLYGHSLGGLIVLAHGIAHRGGFTGAVVSAPALHTSLRRQRISVALTRMLGGVLPGVPVPVRLDPELLSRDPLVVADYRADPLVHRRVTLGFGRDALAAIEAVLRDPGGFPAPLLLIHGSADRVNYLSGSQAVADQLGDACTLLVYDGILHQPHTDPESPRVFADVIGWIDRQVSIRA
jgi:acylglycerol lipase